MPSNRTKRARHSNTLDYWRIDQLVRGDFTIAGVGFASMHRNGCNQWAPEQWTELHDAIRAEWQKCGGDFLAWWRGENERFTQTYAAMGRVRDPEIIPWALTQFGEPK